MLLDVCDWDHAKVQTLYAKSTARRLELGLAEIREHIISQDLAMEGERHDAAILTRWLGLGLGVRVRVRVAMEGERHDPKPTPTPKLTPTDCSE